MGSVEQQINSTSPDQIITIYNQKDAKIERKKKQDFNILKQLLPLKDTGVCREINLQ